MLNANGKAQEGKQGGGANMAPLAEGLPSTHEHPCCVCLKASHLNIREVEAGGSEVHGETWLKFKFEVFLSYMRFCIKNRNKATEFDTEVLWESNDRPGIIGLCRFNFGLLG